VCGIFGIVLTSQADPKAASHLGEMLLESGRRLSYRGYDSVGCATLNGDKPGEEPSIDLRKDVGRLEDIAEALGFQSMSGQRGLIQLRWATFGTPTQINAQPHLDSRGLLVGAHHGNVVNNIELRANFIQEGMTVRSTNDGETCVHAVERYILRDEPLEMAVRHACNDLAGDYSFVITGVNNAEIVAVQMGVPLFAGESAGTYCVSSDLSAILHCTRRVLRIEEGEMLIMHPQRGLELRRVGDNTLVERPYESILVSTEIAQKGGFSHYMLKEIYEQPRVAGELIHLLEDSPNVLPFVDRLADARTIYLVGCGTSHHACLLGSFYFSAVANRLAIPVLAPQFIAQYGPALQAGDVAIFISQSGETRDVLAAEDAARRCGVRTLALVNSIGSTLSRVAERYLHIACGAEMSIPATKSFINQCVAMLYLALKLGDLPSAGLAGLPDLLQEGLYQVRTPIERLADQLYREENIFCLGYGATLPIALEGALKIQEVGYTACLGLVSSELKHGLLSSIRQDFPVIFIAGPENAKQMISGINEVTCRGGKAVVIGEPDESLLLNASHFISLPEAGSLLNPILSILPLQLMAYYIGVRRGLDPDYPRNLSKTLTVD
jgi:glucosamine--fructose-6-phosphate aminotransferase (isomerizing)